MKKYLLGITALVLAIGLSAFNAPPKKEKMPFNRYWYVVKPGWGMASGFTNAIVDYYSTSPTAPAGVCLVFPWNYKCVIGFEPLDVDPATNLLYPGTHYPVAIADKRPNP